MSRTGNAFNFLDCLTLKRKDLESSKLLLLFSRVHEVMSQKIRIFSNTSVRISVLPRVCFWHVSPKVSNSVQTPPLPSPPPSIFTFRKFCHNSVMSEHMINYTCIFMGVQFEKNFQHTGTRSDSEWPLHGLCYRPAIFFLSLRCNRQP